MIKFLATLLIVVLLGIVAIGAYLSPDDLVKCGETPNQTPGCEKADAIVAVSGGNTSVRTAEAIRLFKNGWADKLIFSGAAQDANSPSNALVMKQQAITEGVPATDIIIDQSSRTTHQNAERTDDLIKDYNITRLIVVTSPYHQRRAGLEFKDIFGPTVTVINHPAKSDPDWPWYWWATPRGWWLAVGELVKIGAVHAGETR